ncbi:hypothetical protein [Alkalibacillus salilacus]|uniref:Heme/copper-type cytochrome/quinol oxidase subunit 4 n=1 Tax=Alkalibacillus salilacus TaxID=284582 RepID=A0ABT9VH81_9BACI|nr:hypothetical protein [Alkalibacillus salilacus]MDQ0160318.1 heme/copper-type cytochrome/quinol oxidase subunit 4 [Alkalibacillus salilacus]
MRYLYIALFVGLISSTAMSLYLYIIETFTGKQLYTLLLNIDFIYTPSETVPENFYLAFEYALHVIVATVIVTFYLYLITKKESFWNKRMEIAAILSFMAFLTYFPLTILAVTKTPNAFDIMAIFDWFIAHVIFFFMMYYISEWLLVRNHSKQDH